MPDLSGKMIRLPDGRRLGYGEWGDPHGQPLLYCHGWPGWRAEGQFGNQAAKARGVRLIGPRPAGHGPVGLPAPTPLPALARRRHPTGRYPGAGAVRGRWTLPGGTAGMGRQNRLLFGMVGRLPVLARLLLGAMAVSATTELGRFGDRRGRCPQLTEATDRRLSDGELSDAGR